MSQTILPNAAAHQLALTSETLIMSTTPPLFKLFVRGILTIGFVLLLACPGWPVTIELNTGQVITGAIISKDKDSYKFDTGIGFPVTYFIDEIKTIDGEPISPAAVNVQEEETPPANGEIGSEAAPVLTQPQQPAVAEPKSVLNAEPVPATSPNVSDETQPAAPLPIEEPQDTVQLEDFAIEKSDAGRGKPMAQVIADEINQMMLKNSTANAPNVPVRRSGPGINALEEPAKDVSEIESGLPLKEHPSPFGPTIKSHEVQEISADLDAGKHEERQLMSEIMSAPRAGNATPASVGKNTNTIFRAIDDYMYMQKVRLHFAQANFQQRLPYIKEKLYEIPVRVRRDAFVVILCVLSVIYIFACFPLMNIARKLRKKHCWLVWIPFVQLVYLVHIAGKRLWWAVFWTVPVVNYFMLLLLFVDILKELKKPFWLIILIIIPGINIFALWYLAISQELSIKGELL